ncbi:hypothetical protein DBR18_23755 [Pseudomonas sp. HMWF021]|nr:hypothetical protein DBR18_23755 [Pseudomonas sp. HMWF021]
MFLKCALRAAAGSDRCGLHCPCRSCRRLRSFDLFLKAKIAAFGSSYRGASFQMPETQKPAFAGFRETQRRNLEFELVPRRRLELPRP